MQEVADCPVSSEVTRRSFYLAIIYGAWGLITAVLAIPAAVYLLLPPARKKRPSWVDVGEISAIPSGVPTEISFQRKRVDGWKVVREKTTAWIVRKAETNQVVAFDPQCTHLGCAYHWENQTTGGSPTGAFVCPCHNSKFSLEGQVLDGPAPRPLDRYGVKVEMGRIKIGPLGQQEDA